MTQQDSVHLAVGDGVGSASNIGPTKCAYCSGPIANFVRSIIIDRGYDNRLRRQYVRQRLMDFCSHTCASSYQMGQEG